MGDLDLIDSKFYLDWAEDPSKFKFYYQNSVPRNSILFMKSIISLLLAFVISSRFCIFILENTVGFLEDNLLFYKDVILRFILIVIGSLALLSILWVLFELIFISPSFKLNKSKVIYITDDEGLYVVNYSVGGHDCESSSLFPVIIDRVLKNNKSRGKLNPKYFKSVTYLDSYAVVSSSKDYLVLDIPEDNPIYDDVNDFEILGSTTNFNELRDYLEGNGGM